MEGPKQVAYLCVARRGDGAILAQRVHVPGPVDYLDYTRKVLTSPGWAAVATDKLTLSDGTNTFFVLIEPSGIALIAIATKDYPTRYIYDAVDGRTAGLLGGVTADWLISAGPGHVDLIMRECCRALKTVHRQFW